VWIANEYAFGMNLYENVTGTWFNRGTVKNLPDNGRIDEFKQMMPVYESGELLEKSAELNMGFAGYSMLLWMEPR
jgi:peptide/nickel transport system substrate-binding protein